MEQYGDFTESIRRLDASLQEVGTSWTDKTAQSYGQINENMKHFALEIWNAHSESVEGYNAVKANYDEAEFDDRLHQLNFKIASV